MAYRLVAMPSNTMNVLTLCKSGYTPSLLQYLIMSINSAAMTVCFVVYYTISHRLHTVPKKKEEKPLYKSTLTGLVLLRGEHGPNTAWTLAGGRYRPASDPPCVIF